MDNASYATLTRQSGLLGQMQTIANNIANANTTGFRSESVMFSEHISRLDRNNPSLSMATGNITQTALTQGALEQTGGTFDLAIEGDGFFLVQTPNGERLTRAGSFTPNENGDLVTSDGFSVLDAGGAPVFVPQGLGQIAIAPDGTLSAAGQPITQVAIVRPNDLTTLRRDGHTQFIADAGYETADDGRILQGFLEASNVNPTLEVTRMIEVQRAYELGQQFLEKENERIQGVIDTLGRT